MKRAQEDVREFHRAGGIPCGDLSAPTLVNTELRLKLIKDEVKELEEAIEAGDLIEATDAIGDIIYVAIGAALVWGVDLPSVWEEIQRSNMAKFPGGVVTRRADGKILKPPGWTPPDIKGVLAAQIARAQKRAARPPAGPSDFDLSELGDDGPTLPYWNTAALCSDSCEEG